MKAYDARPLCCALLLMLCSCTADVYDKGEGEYSLMLAEMADVHVGGDLRADYFVTDDDERVPLATPLTVSWMKTPDSTYRAVTYFSRTAAGADLMGLNRVGVAEPRKRDSLKTDPVRFESLWMGHNGQYLNVSIYLMTGAASDEKAIHRLGCNDDTLMANADGTTTQCLTLYHDQGGMPEYYSQRTYVSIPMKRIMADSVRITINTYDGAVKKSLPLQSGRAGLRVGQ